jgi:hypothetical protein
MNAERDWQLRRSYEPSHNQSCLPAFSPSCFPTHGDHGVRRIERVAVTTNDVPLDLPLACTVSW